MTLSIQKGFLLKYKQSLFIACFYLFILPIFTNVNHTLITNKKCN
jgi:hypothetical protein